MNKYPHYHKPVEGLKTVDVYRVLELFEVNDHAIGHAIKKLMCAGKRGGKDFETDIREAVDTLNRRLQMIAEDDGRTHVPSEPAEFWEWHGSSHIPPCAKEKIVTVQYASGSTNTGSAGDFRWQHIGKDGDVMRWRYAS